MKCSRVYQSCARGFTISEILIVTAILIVLTAIILIVAGPSVRKSRTSPTCANNLKSVAVSLNLYMQDYDLVYPKIRLGKEGHLSKYHNDPDCPLSGTDNSSYRDLYFRGINSADSNVISTVDILGRPILEFDPDGDVIMQCLEHGFDGFEYKTPPVLNQTSPDFVGRVLALKADTSVSPRPILSCWELAHMSSATMKGVPGDTLRNCDHP